MVYQLELNIR